MEDIQDVCKTLNELQEGLKLAHMTAIKDVLAPIQTKLEAYMAPNRAKRQKICRAMEQANREELNAAITRYANMRPLRELMGSERLMAAIPAYAQILDPVASKLRDFARANQYDFDSFSAMLYAYLQQHERNLAMDGEAYMAALMDVNDDVTMCADRDTKSLGIFNGTKNIALTIFYGFDDESPRLIRTRFLQHGAADAAMPSNSVDALASHFDGRMPYNAVCGIRSGRREQDGLEDRSAACPPGNLEDLRVEHFVKCEAWWKCFFSFVMEWATYGDYGISDDRAAREYASESWTMTIASVIAIYCYRGPAGEIEVLCFSDPSHDDVQNGVEMYPSHPLYRWTVDTLRATVANLQTRTLAMFDGKPWFRHENRPWVEPAAEEAMAVEAEPVEHGVQS